MIVGIISWVLFFVAQANGQACQLDPQLKTEIHSYQPIVDTIVEAVINGPYKNNLYNDLADFVDDFGLRISGSEALEAAIDNVIERQKSVNLTVSTHSVLVPKWERGEESAEIVSPRRQKLTILGFGNSLNTPKDGITAEVLVVEDFDELEERKNEVAGKIVLYNAKFVTYATTYMYRSYGPSRASALGAVGALVRSLTPFSINSPHTGYTQFETEQLRIPAAAVTVENANLIARLTAKGINRPPTLKVYVGPYRNLFHRIEGLYTNFLSSIGVEVQINLKMDARNYPLSPSRNVIGDITGASKPLEYVTISGHIDNWDVGQGAMDDAGGAFLAWHSLALIKKLSLPVPARTLRAIMWTAEEFNALGAAAYRVERESEIRNWTAAFESDLGVFQARGIEFAGTDDAACIMQEIASLFGKVNATELLRQPIVGSDIGLLQDLGVPLGDLYLVENNYFWYHHSNGDWMDVLKSEDLDQNLAIFASTIYILADLSVSLPKV